MLPSTVLLAAESEADPEPIQMEDVQRFSNAINQIKRYYVKPTDDKELFDNAIRGMLNGLDPHSAYLDEAAYNDLRSSTSGEFGGLGIEVTMENGAVRVVTPLVDSPAYRAGIKAGDYIVKLGKKSVQGLSLQDAVQIMRGKKGTAIDLTILRKGESEPLKFSIIRENILIQSVKSKLLENKYGYIQITQFQASTGQDMLEHIEKLKQEANGPLTGVILDLRNNPGGLLDAAIQVSDAFINNDKQGEEEMIVYTQGRLPGSKFTALANPGDVLDKAPLIVLINNGSASASEIVAGALKDNKRAIILGTKSFGKGSVQTVLPLDSKRAIKLTTALYFTPSGESIQAKGIIPDILIEPLKVSKNEASSEKFNEASLNGHLLNGNGEAEETQKSSPSADGKNLMEEDYQLYAALTILKGLSVAKR
ncbi:S41 family peptidase [Legionella sp. W05-934-2]|jgi:carboxyl-terminal processing protease|uniref:S41 family peptidase n=1 Tax=Legionella sp. W05-934-2 TaxID=1198649 RepID=UPI003461AB02